MEEEKEAPSNAQQRPYDWGKLSELYYQVTGLCPEPIFFIGTRLSIQPLSEAAVKLREEINGEDRVIFPHNLRDLVREAHKSGEVVKGIGSYGEKTITWKLVSVPEPKGVIAYGSLEAGELLHANQALSEQTRFDRLTGLLNTAPGKELLEKRLEYVRETEGSAIFVLTIDIDKFGELNKTHNRRYGDAALKRVATTLDEDSRVFDFVYRRGEASDEFIVAGLTNGYANAHQGAVEYSRRVREQLYQPGEVDGLAIEGLSVSIGATIGQWGDNLVIDELLDQCDAAVNWLKRTKQRGRMTFYHLLPKQLRAWVWLLERVKPLRDWQKKLKRHRVVKPPIDASFVVGEQANPSPNPDSNPA